MSTPFLELKFAFLMFFKLYSFYSSLLMCSLELQTVIKGTGKQYK